MDLASLNKKSTGRWLLSQALLLQQPERGRQEEEKIPGLNIMKINTSALLAADGALFRGQRVQLILQEL